MKQALLGVISGLMLAPGAFAQKTAQPELGKRSIQLLTVNSLQFKDLNKNGKLDKYEDWRLPVEVRVNDLLGQMTLDEKVGFMLISTTRMGGDLLSINFSNPWVLSELDDSAAKTMIATFGTTQDALLDVVSGAFKPTGKLPFTIPSSEKAVSENKSDVPGYLEPNGYALFKFGHGLSY